MACPKAASNHVGFHPVSAILDSSVDQPFIQKYAMADIPYIKASDHIFIAIAKINDYPLVTSDSKMTDVAKQRNIRVFSPTEYLNELAKTT